MEVPSTTSSRASSADFTCGRSSLSIVSPCVCLYSTCDGGQNIDLKESCRHSSEGMIKQSSASMKSAHVALISTRRKLEPKECVSTLPGRHVPYKFKIASRFGIDHHGTFDLSVSNEEGRRSKPNVEPKFCVLEKRTSSGERIISVVTLSISNTSWLRMHICTCSRLPKE